MPLDRHPLEKEFMQADDDFYEKAFFEAKEKALRFIECFNQDLPLTCETCGSANVPGLPCPECSHCHPVPYAILKPGEWGYEVVAISNQRQIIMEFYVDD